MLLANKGKRGVRSKGTPAALRQRTEKFAAKAIVSRGSGSASKEKAGEDSWKVSPWLVGGFLFLLVGSAVAGVLSTQKLVG